MNQELESLFLKYKLALDVLKNKFNSLNLEFSTLWDNNPIEHIKYRIKSISSIEKKLQKKGLPLSSEAIETSLNDVVGTRIVCSFLSDMKTIIYYIKKDPSLKIINEKDYIQTPKQNGYSSYHMIVEVPVFMYHKIVYVRAEIQIRTIAMDMWASLEHKIWYKKNITLPEGMMKEIHKTAQVCSMIDSNLNDLILNANTPTEKNLLDTIPSISEKNFDLFLLKYQVALQQVQNKLGAIYEEFEKKDKSKPIEHIKSRMKKKERIIQKLMAKGKELTFENIQENVNDIAGIRIVCSFQSDLEALIQIITELVNVDSELQLVGIKDYVKNPKPSGYTSYHMIVEVPIYFASRIEKARVEIQLRTIAMDMWASLEHKLCYQKEVDYQIRKELKDMAEVIQIIDQNMNSIIDESRRLSKQKKKYLVRKKVPNS